jgi:Cu+-exporting ATPase
MQTISVDGMTCANCVRHVSEALAEIPDVIGVRVDLDVGIAQIDASREIARDEFLAALDEAGYTLR